MRACFMTSHDSFKGVQHFLLSFNSLLALQDIQSTNIKKFKKSKNTARSRLTFAS
jgi:hypothetical protein